MCTKTKPRCWLGIVGTSDQEADVGESHSGLVSVAFSGTAGRIVSKAPTEIGPAVMLPAIFDASGCGPMRNERLAQ